MSTDVRNLANTFQQAEQPCFLRIIKVFHMCIKYCIQFYPQMPVDNSIAQNPLFPTNSAVYSFVNTFFPQFIYRLSALENIGFLILSFSVFL